MAVRASLGASRGRLVAGAARREPRARRSRRRARLGARLRRARAARRASARATCRAFKEIAVYPPVLAFTRGRFARVDARVRLDHGAQARAARRRARVRRRRAARARAASAARRATRSVVVQVALALVLVVSAVLMIRTFQALRDVDPGFVGPGDDSNRADLDSDSRIGRPERNSRACSARSSTAIAALPGVASAGFASALPMEGADRSNAPVVDRRPAADGRRDAAAAPDASSYRPATSKPWARGSSRDAT